MQTFSSRVVVAALGVLLGLASVGCERFGMLKANMAFKDANQMYSAQDYRGAAEKYMEAIDECRGANPDCTHDALDAAYFFLANSYDNQYRPARRGEPANDALLTNAIKYYKKSAEIEQDPTIKNLAMEYLVAAYGPDKLNDPASAEPVLRQMIELNPTEPSNYTYLSRIYEDSGDYAQAEQLLVTARDRRPTDGGVYVTLAAFYQRQGDFDKAMEALKSRADREPDNPEAYYTIATYYWEKAYRDFTTPEEDKMGYVMSGLEAVDRAIELNPNYADALVYKGLLLRVQATLETSPDVQQRLLAEADEWREKALQAQSLQTGETAQAGAEE